MVILLLYRLNRMHCSIRMIAFFTVIFALALGATSEVIEFSIDRLIGTHFQYGLDDTMYDLITDGLGGLIVAGAGVLWLRTYGGAMAPDTDHARSTCAASDHAE